MTELEEFIRDNAFYCYLAAYLLVFMGVGVLSDRTRKYLSRCDYSLDEAGFVSEMIDRYDR